MPNFLQLESLCESAKYAGLPAPRHPLITIFDFEKTPFQIKIPLQKVVCDFYQISFKANVRGSMQYGRQNYDFQEGSLLYLAPGQVINYASPDEAIVDQGWTLLFHADLMRTFSLDKKMKEYEFFKYESNEALHISGAEKEIIESIIHKIQIELDSHIDDYSEELIATNLELLLNYSKRFYNRQFLTRKRFDKDIVVQFFNTLDAYFEANRQQEEGLPSLHCIAEQLHYSPKYLNELIKKSTDKNILEHIHNKVIDLAKSNLLSSSKTISEIAYELGFEYPQYFSRLFKKKTGRTPKEYRVGLN